jgi:AAA family ATP:ADP antiporter
VKLTASLCGLAFATMVSYAVAGSAAQSLFLSAFGTEALPYAWLGVAVASIVATSWINSLSERFDIAQLFAIGCRASALSLTGILLLSLVAPAAAAFFLYVWKDVYIIVLVELFWTLANIVFGMHSASRAYGLFCAAGSLGGVAGALAIGQGARWLGTQNSLWTLLPLLATIGWGCGRLVRHAPIPSPKGRGNLGLVHALRTLRQSTVLPALMLLVVSAQGWLTLLDFRYSAAVLLLEPGAEGRTALIANVNALINAISFPLQMATGPILRLLGGPLTLCVLPAAASLSLAGIGLSQGAPMVVCAAQVAGKSLDYSLFRAAKEMVYIPLGYAEKTQGKALIDILAYRAVKGLISATLLVLGSMGLAQRAALPLLWAFGVGWALSVAWLLKRMHGHPGLRTSFFGHLRRL